jgi:ATP-dependent helicase/DNAse subunit B
MTLRLIIGPFASGRSERLLAAARAAAGPAVLVVVTAAQKADLLRRLVDTPLRVLTFEEACRETLRAAGRKAEALPSAARGVLMDEAIARTPLVHFASLRGMAGFTQALLRLRFDLSTAGVDPQALRDIGDEARLHELAAVLTAYESLLVANDWFDSVRVERAAAAALDADAALLRGWRWLGVDGFDELSVPQREWLRRAARRPAECVITVVERERASGASSSLLARMRDEITAALDVEAAPPSSRSFDPIREIAAHGRRLDGAPTTAPRIDVHMLEAPNAAGEVREALRWLRRRHLDAGTPYARMALLARDAPPYIALIRSVAEEMKIPVAFAGGSPLTSNPAAAALLELLRAVVPAESGGTALPPRLLVDAWRSPYFDLTSFGITPDDALALDDLARWGHVLHGRAQWEQAFAAAARSGEEDALPFDAAQLHGRFTVFVERLTPPSHASMAEFVAWLRALIGEDLLCVERRAADSEEFGVRDQSALREFMRILSGLEWIDSRIGAARTEPSSALLERLRRTVSGASYDEHEHADADVVAVDALRVHDVTETIGLRYDFVAVLGMAEGRFPATLREDAFLRDADRRALNERFGVHLTVSTAGVEREWFYTAVTRADRAMLVVRPRLTDVGAEWKASPFWDELRSVVAAAPTAVRSSNRPALADAASFTESVHAALADEAAGAPWFAQHAPGLHAHLEAGARVLRMRADGAAAPEDGDVTRLGAVLAARYGSEYVWSATALEEYHSCAYRFFIGRALELQPRPTAQIGPDGAALGRMYHTLFERAYRHADDAADSAAVHAALDRVAPAVFAGAHGFRAAPWWPQTQRDILANVHASIDALADARWVPTHFETDFRDLSVQADGERILLRGRIDRIDRAADGSLRVIDYKSGSASGFVNDDIVAGRRLQLPLYAAHAAQSGRVVDAFHLHYRKAEIGKLRLARFHSDDGDGVQAAQAAAARAAIDAARGVRAGRYAPFPPKDGCPEYCPAAGFCWSFQA